MRVWNPTTVLQPRSANAARVSRGRQPVLQEVVVRRQLDDPELAGDAVVAGVVEGRDAGVLGSSVRKTEIASFALSRE